jgi:hypothetical protein
MQTRAETQAANVGDLILLLKQNHLAERMPVNFIPACKVDTTSTC